MSDILIKGMEMPKKYPVTVTIFPDGVSVVKTISGRRFTATAVPVPPHGRLIDANALDCIGYCCIPKSRNDTFDDGVMWLAEQIDSLPTIIPAEEGEA